MKNNLNKLTKAIFRNLEFPILEAVILRELTLKFINEFTLTPITYVSVLSQMKCVSGKYVTLGVRRPLNVKDSKDVDMYINYLETIFNTLMRNYQTEVPVSIFFNYSIEGEGTFQIMKRIVSSNKIDILKENKLDMLENLPLDRYYSGWGNLVTHVSRLVYLVKDLKYTNLKDKNFEVTDLGGGRSSVKAFTLDGLQLFEFIDSIVSRSEFTRVIGDTSYHIKDNKVYFIYKSIKPNKFITKLPPSKEVKFNHLVLDIETYTDREGIMHMYAISVGSKNKYQSFYLTDYLNSADMVKAVLVELLTRKNTSRILYIHNGSNFDLIFLLKHIVTFPNVKVFPVIRDGSFINLEVRYRKSFSNRPLI